MSMFNLFANLFTCILRLLGIKSLSDYETELANIARSAEARGVQYTAEGSVPLSYGNYMTKREVDLYCKKAATIIKSL